MKSPRVKKYFITCDDISGVIWDGDSLDEAIKFIRGWFYTQVEPITLHSS